MEEDTEDDRYFRPLFDGLCGEGYWDSCRFYRERARKELPVESPEESPEEA